MASFLRRLNPVPFFPDYNGPYAVGTIDVEIPVAELEAPSPGPDDSIPTVQFRVFYPCEADSRATKGVSWLPSPQRAHVSAYTRFMGASSRLAEFVSFFPRQLHYISIPIFKNARLLDPVPERWPVMLFSHGLAGSRNAYSHLAGSVASHGVIVIAAEHRDGSAPISYIRDVPGNATNGLKPDAKGGRRTVDYVRISHTPSPEVEAGRTVQLKIRLWELGCIHDALLKIDNGVNLTNLSSSSVHLLHGFKEKMAVHEPGSIIFGGHSFGAATVVQLIKSTYYSAEEADAPASYEPIFTPSSRSQITQQITSNTAVILLDTWCFPLKILTTRWLWNKPLPCYAKEGPGGCAILAVESQTFFNWRLHLKVTKRMLSPNPASNTCKIEDDSRPAPHFFYVSASAHLSQSDFGILFPWLTRKVFAAEEPERAIRLNVRAILQLLRERRVPVSSTSAADMELRPEAHSEIQEDTLIFSTEPGTIRGWNHLSVNADDLDDVTIDDDSDSDLDILKTEPMEPIIGEDVVDGAPSTTTPSLQGVSP